jgi:acetolactate synthase-1/3 small subunit
MESKHILCLLVDNESGVLQRIAGLISRRGFNITTLSVGETSEPSISRMTITVDCDMQALDQMVEQLKKLVNVRTLRVLPLQEALLRELLLIKVSTTSQNRGEILELAGIFRARVVDVSVGSLTLEITGEGDKTTALLSMMEQYGILEIARTGGVALERGVGTIYGE